MLDALLEITRSYLLFEGKKEALLLESERFRQLSTNFLFESDEQLVKGSQSTDHLKTVLIHCFSFIF